MHYSTKHILLKEDELSFSYIKSSGPGGQNINKVSTGVQLRFNVKRSKYLKESLKNRIMENEKNRINKNGELIIEAKRLRSREQNKLDAIERLRKIIAEALLTKRRRIKTHPSINSRENRIKRKKKISLKKSLRKRVNPDYI